VHLAHRLRVVHAAAMHDGAPKKCTPPFLCKPAEPAAGGARVAWPPAAAPGCCCWRCCWPLRRRGACGARPAGGRPHAGWWQR
jgi:hypothetical protein